MATPDSATTATHPVSTGRAVAGIAALALWLGWVIPLLYRDAPTRGPSLGADQAVCSPTAVRR